eukprot:1126526_1
MAAGDFPPDIACVSENNTINEIKFSDGYQYDAVCPHDNLHFKSVQDWKNHHFNNHMDTKWKCPLCATVSASWYNYAYHVQIQEHNSTCPPPWICKLKVSPKLSKNKKAHSTINRCTPHMSHSPERKLCEKRFGSKYQMLRHIKSHTNYKIMDDDKIINRKRYRLDAPITTQQIKKRRIDKEHSQSSLYGFKLLLQAAMFIEKHSNNNNNNNNSNNRNNSLVINDNRNLNVR